MCITERRVRGRTDDEGSRTRQRRVWYHGLCGRNDTSRLRAVVAYLEEGLEDDDYDKTPGR